MRVLVTGASGQLGGYLLKELTQAEVETIAWSGSRTGSVCEVPLRPVDLGDPSCVAAAFDGARPDAVIHAGGMASVADCHKNPDLARRINVQGTAVLAELAKRNSSRFVYVSTDLVFDGEKSWYREQDAPSPLSAYGRTKADAESIVKATPNGVVARVSLLYGPSLVGRTSFFDQQVIALREGRPLTLFEDEWRTPVDMTTAARALAAIASSDFVGTLHVGGPERMTRLEMGRRMAACLKLDSASLNPSSRAEACFAEPRPRDTSLDSSQWRRAFPNLVWPHLELAIQQMISVV